MAIVTVQVEVPTTEAVDQMTAALTRTISLVAPDASPRFSRGEAWTALGSIASGISGHAFLATSGSTTSGKFQQADGCMPYVIVKFDNADLDESFNVAILTQGNRLRQFRTALSQAIDKAILLSRKGRGPGL